MVDCIQCLHIFISIDNSFFCIVLNLMLFVFFRLNWPNAWKGTVSSPSMRLLVLITDDFGFVSRLSQKDLEWSIFYVLSDFQIIRVFFFNVFLLFLPTFLWKEQRAENFEVWKWTLFKGRRK